MKITPNKTKFSSCIESAHCALDPVAIANGTGLVHDPLRKAVSFDDVPGIIYGNNPSCRSNSISHGDAMLTYRTGSRKCRRALEPQLLVIRRRHEMCWQKPKKKVRIVGSCASDLAAGQFEMTFD